MGGGGGGGNYFATKFGSEIESDHYFATRVYFLWLPVNSQFCMCFLWLHGPNATLRGPDISIPSAPGRSGELRGGTSQERWVHSGHSVDYLETFPEICRGHFRGCSRLFGGYLEVILEVFEGHLEGKTYQNLLPNLPRKTLKLLSSRYFIDY